MTPVQIAVLRELHAHPGKWLTRHALVEKLPDFPVSAITRAGLFFGVDCRIIDFRRERSIYSFRLNKALDVVAKPDLSVTEAITFAQRKLCIVELEAKDGPFLIYPWTDPRHALDEWERAHRHEWAN